MDKLIVEVIEATVEKMMVELRRERMLSGGGVVGGTSAFKKTEQLLYMYPSLLKIVEEKKQEIEEIKMYGVRGKSKSIVVWSPKTNVQGGGTVLSEDTVQNAVEAITQEIEKVESTIQRVEEALSKVESDPYYYVVKMRYFDGLVNEAIADEVNRDASTITRNKNRLVGQLATYLFPTNKIDEIELA